ncbi:3,4-dihydroxy-2-butanone-4-phosphate synthase [Amycolatopsis acidiphila]|uniref:3,4-dihydroxy-2-butanone 4-phosphate synthase n=1 Tax=Amycolatopsis acidiphila TaxID=715473 RepID=A0A558AJ28_9PSEU|nr:3,4-dihydroxy-2-butanone-4-phosphate synthase [Amycolatopsis acidiphila]TVT24270.1 3,4-dihydroxy-2-butanone-4-phosphate synthase [Amycolatopsis acidiphila]UIJ62600.1 3,4-dihydroxy-2-butanone-4-phosphate synthase [Amycolatopsis acidiphila]GHG85681.1 hypothetical protein GCM10017788_58520 [Amycolatopsis acidiphila]
MTPALDFVARVETAVAEIAAGRAVVVTDDHDREDEGDLIFAAELATAGLVAFTVRHGSGVLCVAMDGDRLDALRLPPMCVRNEDPKGTAYAVSVDARQGVGTGISAADRARTLRLLADPATTPGELTRPGHVFPLRARPGGVLERRGHTEAAVELTRLAGLPEAGALCEIVHDEGTLRRGRALDEFCAEHGLHKLSVADLVRYRRRPVVAGPVRLPTPHGKFKAMVCVDEEAEHLALVLGEVAGRDDVPVHVHTECLTGDVFGARGCGCAARLDQALTEIRQAGAGVLVYLRRTGSLLGSLRGGACGRADPVVAARVLADLRVASARMLGGDSAVEAALTPSGVGRQRQTRARHRTTIDITRKDPRHAHPAHPA